MLSSVLCSPLKPSVCHLLLFHTLCPCSLSSLLFLPCHPNLILHLCVLQPLDTFSDSSPSVGRQHAFQPRGHNAVILTNQWQINQCYLFFPCLCCHRFFFCYFVVCQDLNFAQLNWVHFQTQIVTAWGFQLRQTLMLATDGAYRSFIYEMPHWNRSCSGFLLKLNLDLSVLRTLFQMRHARCLLWLSGLSFWPRANIYNTDKTNTFWSYLLRKKEVQFACK